MLHHCPDFHKSNTKLHCEAASVKRAMKGYIQSVDPKRVKNIEGDKAQVQSQQACMHGGQHPQQ